MPRRIDWLDPDMELPRETNKLYTEWEAFSKVLLPLKVGESQRFVQIQCRKCTFNAWTQTLPARDHAQTRNLWTHLEHKHPRCHADLQAVKERDNPGSRWFSDRASQGFLSSQQSNQSIRSSSQHLQRSQTSNHSQESQAMDT